MFPGGKPEPGEQPVDTAIRELSEEIGLSLSPQDLVFKGSFLNAAANETGQQVRAQVFQLSHRLSADEVSRINPHAEIAELRWVAPKANLRKGGADGLTLAPLLSEDVFPYLCAQGLDA